ncbi:MAG: hypothetical protein ABI687_03580 [Flavitalea sp.]
MNKPFAILKLASLFAKYLYQQKKLNLPGIGVFSIDPAIPVPEVSDKTLSDFIKQIRYVQQPVAAPDEAFISFIRTETGKIKPLAESDLDSFISDGKILLNIGKPFHFEGIGSLLKARNGLYEFTPGEPSLERLEHYLGEQREDRPNKKYSYDEVSARKTKSVRRSFIIASLVAGIGLIIWGGYSLYNRHSAPIETATVVIVPDTAVYQKADTALAAAAKDSISKNGQSGPAAPAGSYKFVIEKTNRLERATKRYIQLKSYYKDIQMETKDSISFSLYFIRPALAADTAKVKDSLKRLYGSRQVTIE